MPYYRGDYYRGDYYRGDFWDTIKKIGTTIGRVAGGIAGIAGGAAGAIGGIVGRTALGGHGPPAPPGAGIPGAGFTGPPQPGGGGGPLSPGPVMKGYHWNKSNEYNPGAHKQIVVPKHTRLVKNRHMNVANPRALARAARRAHGFLSLSKRFTRYYTPHAHKGRAYIGRRKKR